MSIPEPAFDDEGYPTDATLEIIRVWPYQDFSSLFVFVQKAWRYQDYFITLDSDFFQLSTGGWSGNEDIIRKLQENRMFWSLCWESSRRGGHHEFRLPRRPA